jgi:hypothetical protein
MRIRPAHRVLGALEISLLLAVLVGHSAFLLSLLRVAAPVAA